MEAELAHVLFGAEEAVAYWSFAEETDSFLAPGVCGRGGFGSVGDA
jgi:hypothetical protein